MIYLRIKNRIRIKIEQIQTDCTLTREYSSSFRCSVLGILYHPSIKWRYRRTMAQETVSVEKVQTKTDPMEVIAMLLKQNNELLRENTALRTDGNGTTKKGRAPRAAVRCMDTKTGNAYHSHASAGMAVAPEFGLKVHNFVWYEVITKAPGRFTDISEEKYQAVLKANAEKQEANITPPAPVAAPVNPPAPVAAPVNTTPKPGQNQGHRH